MSTGPQLAAPVAATALPKGRSPLAHLLHALNQPLTGLQCSMELAASGPRPSEQYVRVLREGLELAARMRILVAAIRELVDIQQDELEEGDVVLLDEMLGSTVDELRPLAESRGIHLETKYDAGLAIRMDRRWLGTVLFRSLESMLSLAGEASNFNITATRAQTKLLLTARWTAGPPPEHSPFSPAELGLLIAQAGWERAGAAWDLRRAGDVQTCTILVPLASSLLQSKH